MYTNTLFGENDRRDYVQNTTVAKAQRMLEVIASTPIAQLPPDVELNSISVGEMADLCTIQSSNLSDFQQDLKKEEDSQRHQSQGGGHGRSAGISEERHRHHHHHHHHHHQKLQQPSDSSEHGSRSDHNHKAEPVNFYYEPLNPYRMQKAERAPHMEEARLDIRMQKLYENLKPFDDNPPPPPPPPPPLASTNDPRTRYNQQHPAGGAFSRNY